jgi:hypothetical protein
MEPQPLWRLQTPHEWEPFNFGPCQLTFLHRDGAKFNGSQEDFLSEHGSLFGLKNKTTGMVILINHYGEIAARGEYEGTQTHHDRS